MLHIYKSTHLGFYSAKLLTMGLDGIRLEYQINRKQSTREGTVMLKLTALSLTCPSRM